jgi:hypothetical protein
VWATVRVLAKAVEWQLAQNVFAGKYGFAELSDTVLFHTVFGPLRMNFAAEPCGPLGSVATSDSWQSEQLITLRVVVLHGKLVVTRLVRVMAPRLPPALASTGWKEPAVLVLVQVGLQVPALAGLNSLA